MKLTSDEIKKIEAILTMREEGSSGKSIMIEVGIKDIGQLSGFYAVLRVIGVSLPKRYGVGFTISKAEKEQFLHFLAEKKAERSAAPEKTEASA